MLCFYPLVSFTEFLHHFFINKKSEIFSQTSKGERGESGNKKDRERERAQTSYKDRGKEGDGRGGIKG